MNTTTLLIRSFLCFSVFSFITFVSLCARHFVLIKPKSRLRIPICVCTLFRCFSFASVSVVFFSQCIRRWRALGAWPLSRLQ